MSNKTITIKQLEIHWRWQGLLSLCLLMSVLISLGFWQLDRAESKRTINREQVLTKASAPIALSDISLDAINITPSMRVMVEGEYVNQQSIFIQNQVFQGRRGYEVMTPMVVAGEQRWVLISRGWVPESKDPENIPALSGKQELVGEIFLPNKKSFLLAPTFEQSTWPIKLHHFNFDSISEAYDGNIFPFIIRLDATSPGVLQRHWQTKVLNPGTNTSYALQWFAMALLALVISIVFNSNTILLLQQSATDKPYE